MTTKAQKSANRQNAKHSTGPTTHKGKSASSKNARKHGLTTPPERVSVLNWYKMILSDLEASPNPLEQNPRLKTAYQLAEAEARLERVQKAEVHHLQRVQKYAPRSEPINIMELTMEDSDHPEVLRFLVKCLRDPVMREGIRIGLSSSPNRTVALTQTSKRLARYRREAEAQRRRALKSWIRICGQQD